MSCAAARLLATEHRVPTAQVLADALFLEAPSRHRQYGAPDGNAFLAVVLASRATRRLCGLFHPCSISSIGRRLESNSLNQGSAARMAANSNSCHLPHCLYAHVLFARLLVHSHLLRRYCVGSAVLISFSAGSRIKASLHIGCIIAGLSLICWRYHKHMLIRCLHERDGCACSSSTLSRLATSGAMPRLLVQSPPRHKHQVVT